MEESKRINEDFDEDPDRTPLKYEPSLDGIRAIAISSVVIYHVAGQKILSGGWAGVDVFFVLSGYLITRLLLEEINFYGKIDFNKFYIRRVLRLTPAFAALLGADIIFSIFAANKKDVLESIAISATYLMNWNRAFDWLPQGNLGHTWSLSMEEQFYVLWPLLLTVLYKRRPLFWVSLASVIIILWRIVLAVSGSDPERTYNGFDTHADALMIGCAVALYKFSPWMRDISLRFVAIPIFAMICILLFMQHRTLVTQTVGLSAAALAAAWIMLAALQKGWLKSILSIGVLRYTGRISYGWYLWHYPILLLGSEYIIKFIPHYGSVIVIVAGYLVAMASYHFVEKPFLRLKSRFEPDGQRGLRH